MIKKHWGFLLGLLFVCSAVADTMGTFDALKLRPGTLPSTGKNGELRVDAADSNALKKYDETTTSWQEITGGGAGGSGGINYYGDYQADTIGNLVEFDDTAAGGDLDGGSAGNLSTALETTTPISETNSYRISKSGADASFEGVNFTVDSALDELALNGKTLVFSFNYVTSANYNNGTEQVSIYYFRVGEDTVAQACNGRTLGGDISASLGVAAVPTQFSCALNLTSSTTSVRFAFLVTGTGTSTWTLDVDTIKISPDQTVPAPIATARESCTITGTWVTNVTYTGRCRRINNELLVEGTIVVTGAPTSATLDITIPYGLTLDTSKISTTVVNEGNFGTVWATAAGTRIPAGAVAYASTTAMRMLTTNSGTTNSQSAITATVPGTFANGDEVHFNFTIPILEWSDGSALVSTTQADFSTSKARMYFAGAQTVSSSSATVVALDTEAYEVGGALSVDTAGNEIDVLVSGYYLVTANVRYNGVTAAEQIAGQINVDGSGVAAVHSTASSAGGGSNSIATIVYINAGSYVELVIDSTADTSYSINANDAQTHLEVMAIPDFSTFGVYGSFEVGEQVSSAFDITTAGFISGEWPQYTGNSITLKPGTWRVKVRWQHAYSGSAPGFTDAFAGLYAENGDNTNTTPDAITTISGLSLIADTGNARNLLTFNAMAMDAEYIFSLSSAATLYANSRMTFGTANGTSTMTLIYERLR